MNNPRENSKSFTQFFSDVSAFIFRLIGSLLLLNFGSMGLNVWRDESMGAVTFSLMSSRPESLFLLLGLGYLLLLHVVRFFWISMSADENGRFCNAPVALDQCIRWNSWGLALGLVITFLIWGGFATKSPDVSYLLPSLGLLAAAISAFVANPKMTWGFKFVNDLSQPPDETKGHFSQSSNRKQHKGIPRELRYCRLEHLTTSKFHGSHIKLFDDEDRFIALLKANKIPLKRGIWDRLKNFGRPDFCVELIEVLPNGEARVLDNDAQSLLEDQEVYGRFVIEWASKFDEQIEADKKDSVETQHSPEPKSNPRPESKQHSNTDQESKLWRVRFTEDGQTHEFEMYGSYQFVHSKLQGKASLAIWLA